MVQAEQLHHKGPVTPRFLVNKVQHSPLHIPVPLCKHRFLQRSTRQACARLTHDFLLVLSVTSKTTAPSPT